MLFKSTNFKHVLKYIKYCEIERECKEHIHNHHHYQVCFFTLLYYITTILLRSLSFGFSFSFLFLLLLLFFSSYKCNSLKCNYGERIYHKEREREEDFFCSINNNNIKDNIKIKFFFIIYTNLVDFICFLLLFCMRESEYA